MADNNNDSISSSIKELVKALQAKEKGGNVLDGKKSNFDLNPEAMKELNAEYDKAVKSSEAILKTEKEKFSVQERYTKAEKRLLKTREEYLDTEDKIKKIENSMVLIRGKDNKAYAKSKLLLDKLRSAKDAMYEEEKANIQEIKTLDKEYGDQIEHRNKEISKSLKEQEAGDKKKISALEKTRNIAGKIDSVTGSSLTSFLSLAGILKIIFNYLDDTMTMGAKLHKMSAVTYKDMLEGTDSLYGTKKLMFDIHSTAKKWGKSADAIKESYLDIASYSKKMSLGDLKKQADTVERYSVLYNITSDNVLNYRKTLIKTFGYSQKNANEILATSLDHFADLSKSLNITTHRSKDYLDVIMSITDAMKDYGLSAQTAQKMTDVFISTYKKAGYTMEQSMARAKKAMTHFAGGSGEEKWAQYTEGRQFVKEIGGTSDINKLKKEGIAEKNEDKIAQAKQLAVEKITNRFYKGVKLDDKQKLNIERMANVMYNTAGQEGSASQAWAASDAAKGSRAKVMLKTGTFDMLRRAGGAEDLATIKATVGGDFDYAELSQLAEDLRSSKGTETTFLNLVEKLKTGKEAKKKKEGPLTNEFFEKNSEKLENIAQDTAGILAKIQAIIFDKLNEIINSLKSFSSFFDFMRKHIVAILGVLIAIKVASIIRGIGGSAAGAATAVAGAVKGGAVAIGTGVASLGGWGALAGIVAPFAVAIGGAVVAGKLLASVVDTATDSLDNFTKGGFKRYTNAVVKGTLDIEGAAKSQKRKDTETKVKTFTALALRYLKDNGKEATAANIDMANKVIRTRLGEGKSLKQQQLAAGITNEEVNKTKIAELGTGQVSNVVTMLLNDKFFQKGMAGKLTDREGKYEFLKNLPQGVIPDKQKMLIDKLPYDNMYAKKIFSEEKLDALMAKARTNLDTMLNIRTRSDIGTNTDIVKQETPPTPKATKSKGKAKVSVAAGGKFVVEETTTTEYEGWEEAIGYYQRKLDGNSTSIQ